MPKIVNLWNDSDVSPDDWDGWKLYSFNRRHGNVDPYQYLERADGGVRGANVGIRRKLDVGTAFVLSCYEHSGVQWGLPGEVHQCQWDTSQVAGILIWEGKISDLPKGLDKRRECARGYLEAYNAWANGCVYGFTVEDVKIAPCGHKEEPEIIDSCGGFYDVDDGLDYMAEEIRNLLNGDTDVEITGEAAWLSQYHDFTGRKEADVK